MKSYDVIRNAVEEPGVKTVAAALKVSSALVYKWCEPPADESDPDQSGARNPLDRVREIFHITKDIRVIRWLCNDAGGFFVSNPPPALEKNTDKALFAQTRNFVRDFAQLLDSVTASSEDDHSVDPDEADEIRQKWEQLKSSVEHFVVLCEKGYYHIKKPKPPRD